MIIEDILSKLLYSHDLIGTCCTVNKGMEDEYKTEASQIRAQLVMGIPFRLALYSVFSERFWDGCLDGAEFYVYLIETQYYNQILKYNYAV